MNTFRTPDGFFENQRQEVLHAVRPPRVHWQLAVAALFLLALGTFFWPRQETPCESFACLLDATPSEELPLEWAMETWIEDEAWTEWAVEHLDETAH